jgi:hypothetical protein
MRRSLLSLAMLFAVSLGATNAALAECRSDDRPLPDLPTATVKTSVKKLNFIRYRCEGEITEARCKLKTFVVGGDKVFIVGDQGSQLVCAGYLGRGGSYTEGWLPLAGLVFD